MSHAATARSLLLDATRTLRDAGVDSPRLDAELILAHVLEVARDRLIVEPDAAVPEALAARFTEMTARRAAREPLAQILGAREFWSLPLKVTRETLSPRPDSETLVAAVLEDTDPDAALRVLDIGTGTGCLMLAILSERSAASGVGIDLSPAAATVARENARHLGLSDRATIVEGDLLPDADSGPFDIVVSNPPYIPSPDIAGLMPEVARYEPRGALDGGPDGLDLYRRIAREVPAVLQPGGRLYLEVGHDQAGAVADLLRHAGFADVRHWPDLAGTARVVGGRWPT